KPRSVAAPSPSTARGRKRLRSRHAGHTTAPIKPTSHGRTRSAAQTRPRRPVTNGDRPHSTSAAQHSTCSNRSRCGTGASRPCSTWSIRPTTQATGPSPAPTSNGQSTSDRARHLHPAHRRPGTDRRTLDTPTPRRPATHQVAGLTHAPTPQPQGDRMTNRLKHIAPRIAPTVNARVVTLDIERIPGQHSTWHRGQTITGPFWDLNEIKAWTGKRIHADDVSDWPRTICAAWKWYDQPDTEFAAEWEVGGYDGFMRAVWDVFDRADLIIGHNAERFDAKHLMGGWAEMGLPAPSPYKVIDTLKTARGTFAYESNT